MTDYTDAPFPPGSVPEEWRVLARLDKNQALITQTLTSLKDALDKQDKRLSALESNRWPSKTIPVLMAVGMVLTLAFTFLKDFA